MSVTADTRALAARFTASDASASPSLAMRIAMAAQAINPLLAAARILLQALAETPRALDANGAAAWRQWLVREVAAFAKVCGEIGLRQEHIRGASYCLCAAIDEAAARTRWGRDETGGIDWQGDGLAVAAGHDRQGGDRVFHLLDEALCAPGAHADLLAVFQNVLDLGFEGRYRFAPGGRERLQALREQLHAVIMMGGPGGLGDAGSLGGGMMPRHWRPSPAVDPWVRRKRGRGWLAAMLMAAILLGVAAYAAADWWRVYRLRQDVAAAHAQLVRSLDDALRDQIAAGNVILADDAGQKRLTLQLIGTFEPGETRVAPWAASIAATLGRRIAASAAPAQVDVLGHADSMALKMADRRSNQALSEARAQLVAQILLAAGVPVRDIRVRGKGDIDPIEENRTAYGRMRNRRVEIVVAQ